MHVSAAKELRSLLASAGSWAVAGGEGLEVPKPVPSLFIFFPIYNVNLSGKKLRKCLVKGNKAKQTVLCCPVSGGKGRPIVARGKTHKCSCVLKSSLDVSGG